MIQKAVLIGINLNISGRERSMDSLEELAMLSETAGAVNAVSVLKNIKKIDPAYYLSMGMLEDIKGLVLSVNADIVIIDASLSPAQENNLSEYFDLNVVDRTRLILDIFAAHAKTAEGKCQVELAMMNYILPRLKGAYMMLSSTGAGIGTRGPGETKLETDRRKVRQKITHIKNKLKLTEKTRLLHRSKRNKQGLSTAAIVGYTNSGKTTLMRNLTGKGEKGEDKLFATLGTKAASIYDNIRGKKVIVSDTVGFIRNLPLFLIESFKATLEETAYSDMLLHVIDPTQKDVLYKSEEVIKTLNEIGVGDKKMIVVLNKIDLLSAERADFLKTKLERLMGKPVVLISAKTGENKNLLKEKIFELLL
ncbi:MAG TPA: GTPase HflX [bacterium]|nr:GTPase HflX [bacterium]